ncbi:hypothetical protein M0R45_008219 [Rubus argutus]|uniref:C-JID domain-containing protein n=1 Tax=Rubus argutus TaxID=59490 RepID=A0AAW1Y1K4_RUBAR
MQDSLRTTHGIRFSGVTNMPNWFNHQSNNSSVSVQLPTKFYTKSRPWIAYTLYVDFVVLGDIDTSNDFKLMHKFDCFYNTKNGPCHKHTLSHEVNVMDVPVGSSGYWIYVPHLWFSQQLIDLNCSSIEDHTRSDSAAVEVKMTDARLLYQQEFEGFVQAIRCSHPIRIKKFKEHLGGEIKSNLKEQGGELNSIYSKFSSRTHLSISDSTISLNELLESLPLRCHEGRKYTGVKYYVIHGKFTNPQTTMALEEIIQDSLSLSLSKYSGKHDLRYREHFLQSEIPESFCCVKGSSATFPMKASLGSIIGWKGIALCVSVALHKDPSLILDDLYSKNPYKIYCSLVSSNGWCVRMISKITKSEVFGLKRVGLICILYKSSGSFSESMLNGCTSMRVKFSLNSKDIKILSCGHQVVFHQNVDELVETIMLCSRKYKHNDNEGGHNDDGEEDDNVNTLVINDVIASV